MIVLSSTPNVKVSNVAFYFVLIRSNMNYNYEVLNNIPSIEECCAVAGNGGNENWGSPDDTR